MQQLAWNWSSKTDEWRTDAQMIARVVRMLGRVDLDPCSDPVPYSVPATLHYTKADNGLIQHWHGRVYMNPPYGREIPVWMAKLQQEINAGRVTEAITLTPARTETEWFQMLWGADALCFVRGRMRFNGATINAPFPSVLGYFGRRRVDFTDAFEGIGHITYPMLKVLR